ncbi:MAG: GNAT family N-acetyltransferase [Myxococcota bacterium]
MEETRGEAPVDAQAIRRRVFVDEQGVARDDEWDEHDRAGSDTLHFVALAAGAAVGCARLRAYGADAKVERVAVLPEQRGTGLGRLLMAAVERAAGRCGHREFVLHAQADSIPFYEHLGWRAEGPQFEEAGIAHRKMRKALVP